MNLLRCNRVDLLETLKHSMVAAEYIKAALDEEDPKALARVSQDVAQAHALGLSEEESDAFGHVRASLARAGLKLTEEAR